MLLLPFDFRSSPVEVTICLCVCVCVCVGGGGGGSCAQKIRPSDLCRFSENKFLDQKLCFNIGPLVSVLLIQLKGKAFYKFSIEIEMTLCVD